MLGVANLLALAIGQRRAGAGRLQIEGGDLLLLEGGSFLLLE